MKKNCYSCIHLAYYEKETPESFEDEGYCCNARRYRSELEESLHLSRMHEEDYLERPKKCCEQSTARFTKDGGE